MYMKNFAVVALTYWDIALKPWRRSIVVIVSAYKTEQKIPGSNPAMFLGIYTLQRCCHNFICIVIVCTWEK
jgi:hypothetical protein